MLDIDIAKLIYFNLTCIVGRSGGGSATFVKLNYFSKYHLFIKHMKKITLFVTAFLILHSLSAQIAGPGDILFLGLSGDGNDVVVFTSLKNIPNNQVVYFNENEWNGSPIGSGGAFNTGEGSLTWTNNTGSDLAPGTVITLTNLASGTIAASVGTVSKSGTFNIAGSDDALYAFIGTNSSTPTAFLSYIANGTVSASGSITNTGLVIGTNGIIFTSNPDVMVLSSFMCDGTTSDCSLYICDVNNWSTEDGSNDQSNNSVFPDLPADAPTSVQMAPMPVNMILFNAYDYNNIVTLSFSTATEHNNDHFDIERSADGRIFEKIGEVKGAGNSIVRQDYTYTDQKPLNGVNYYRLKQVDFDGAFTYSPVRSVVFGKAQLVTVFPTPANSTLTIRLDEALTENAQWQIMDMTGRIVGAGTFVAETNEYSLPVSTLTEGAYVLQIATATQVLSQQFRKQ
jgi:hypothetical protein